MASMYFLWVILLSSVLCFREEEDGLDVLYDDVGSQNEAGSFDAAESSELFCKIPRLGVTYGSHQISCGNEVGLGTVSSSSAPEISLDSADENNLYSLIMYDPDAPSSTFPSCRSWLHWLVTNIENRDIADALVVAKYNPPTPPSGSGPHRYRFVLLKQLNSISPAQVTERCKFNVDEFIASQSLTVVAGNEFKTEQA